MKVRLLEELKTEYDAVHGCYRPAGGPCFYLASRPAAADYGRRQGRRFVAAVEDRDGTLIPKISLKFLVATMAQRVWAEQIGNLDEFCREVGLERFREALERDPMTERDDEIVLTKESEESQFQRPNSAKAIHRYLTLKNEIIHMLAGRHAQGQRRVPFSAVLEGLCDDPEQVTRALNELVELSLIRDLRDSEGMRLTAEGQKTAEAALPASVPAQQAFTQRKPESYNVFISHASEDKDTFVRPLAEALRNAGLAVWYDEFSLEWGTSLRQSIDQGLANSKHGLVILSHNFFAKDWPQKELNGLFATMNSGERRILPIWHQLSRDELAKYSPMLSDLLAVNSTEGVAAIVRRVVDLCKGSS